MVKPVCAILVLVLGAVAHAGPLTATAKTDLAGAIDGLTAAAENSGYQLVKVQPIDQALIKRGYPNPGMRILFIGKSSAVEQAMKANPKLLSVLPLRLTLIVEDERVIVSSDDLEMWKAMFPDPATVRLIEGWQHDLGLILSDLSGR
jgi:Uncharacterized conserved protein